ncbi:hypothetical protein GQ457_15G023150 [Hibiscus cannabinus]
MKRNEPTICFECKKSGQVKYDCLKTKKIGSSHKKKAFVVTWSDEEDFIDNEEANLCLMTIQGDEVTSNSSPSISYTFDELQ